MTDHEKLQLDDSLNVDEYYFHPKDRIFAHLWSRFDENQWISIKYFLIIRLSISHTNKYDINSFQSSHIDFIRREINTHCLDVCVYLCINYVNNCTYISIIKDNLFGWVHYAKQDRRKWDPGLSCASVVVLIKWISTEFIIILLTDSHANCTTISA